mmetsp:Transcript_5202/g.15450  ORF Transcript_5202/g.15450 Transcript_5202/m.15450 type:complete len:133 (-) Transcript_5202:81-479(-)
MGNACTRPSAAPVLGSSEGPETQTTPKVPRPTSGGTQQAPVQRLETSTPESDKVSELTASWSTTTASGHPSVPRFPSLPPRTLHHAASSGDYSDAALGDGKPTRQTSSRTYSTYNTMESEFPTPATPAACRG